LVYTRNDPAQAFTRAYLDIREFSEFGLQEIPEVDEAELPAFVQAYLDRKKLSLEQGTVVVWANLDRLTYESA